MSHTNEMRLQRILAMAGIASRRASEQYVLEGRVEVNGKTVDQLGAKADPWRDRIYLDGRPLKLEPPVYLLMNKPKGYVTTVKDDQGRPTVMALLKGISVRVYPVGRLDFNSEGMLLLTNDGEVTQTLSGPEHQVPKIYEIKVYRIPKKETLDELRQGFRLDGRRLKPCQIEVLESQQNAWLRVVLFEGKNQQIRRMFAAVGHPVSKLKRVAYGPLCDERLKPGEWRFLSADEIKVIRSL